MKSRITLLSTATAALLIGSGFALAQDKGAVAPERAPPAQRSAPAEKVAPPMNAGERKAPETTGQATQNGAPSRLEPGKGGNVQQGTGAGAAGEMKSSPAERTDKGANKDMGADKNMGADKDMKRSDDTKAGDRARTNAETKPADDKADKSAAGASDRDRKSTTGQGAAAGAAKLSAEQRSKITTIIKQKKVEPVNLDITINVGTRVPPTVKFYPVPVEVIEVYPEWRGHDYIIVGGDILILEPDSHVIVAIIAA